MKLNGGWVQDCVIQKVTNLCENVPETCIQPPEPHAVRFQPFLNDVTSLPVRLVLVRVLEE